MRKWLFGLAAGLSIVLLGSVEGWTKPPGGGGGGGGDTSRIAFVANHFGQGPICTIRGDGTGFVQLTNDGVGYMTPTWSADGQYLAAGIPWSTLRILRVSDGAVVHSFTHPASSEAGVRWSRQKDGTGTLLPAMQQLLAYAPWGGGGTNIFARKPDGTGTPVALTSLGVSGVIREHALVPFWLPADANGNARIAYLKTEEDITVPSSPIRLSREVRVMTLDTSAWPALTVLSDDLIPGGSAIPDSDDLWWDRNATKVAYKAGLSGLFVAPVTESGGVFSINWAAATLIDTGKNPRSPTFSPDASKIALIDYKRPNQYFNRLWVVGADGSGLKKISESNAGGPDWGP